MLEIIEAILCSFQKEILSQVVVKILCWRYPFHLMFRMEFNLFDYYMSIDTAYENVNYNEFIVRIFFIFFSFYELIENLFHCIYLKTNVLTSNSSFVKRCHIVL
jgi:hypothetical protein